MTDQASVTLNLLLALLLLVQITILNHLTNKYSTHVIQWVSYCLLWYKGQHVVTRLWRLCAMVVGDSLVCRWCQRIRCLSRVCTAFLALLLKVKREKIKKNAQHSQEKQKESKEGQKEPQEERKKKKVDLTQFPFLRRFWRSPLHLSCKQCLAMTAINISFIIWIKIRLIRLRA